MQQDSPQWQRFDRNFYHDEELGFSLDISRMRFDETFMQRMAEPWRAAHVAMKQLEAGSIANPDEKRMVGHYWLRAPELAPTPEIRAEIENTIKRIHDLAASVHGAKIRGEEDEPFTDFLLIGIGGSMLGPQLVADALGALGDLMRPHFMDNTDPDGIARTLAELEGKFARTLAVVISKSGGTPETRNGMLEAEAAWKEARFNFARHAIAVTGAGSKLDDYAKKQGWLARLPMWDWVGGRTSVTSAVGLLPAALQGVDVDLFLAGARAMDERTRSLRLEENPAGLLALMWHWAGEGRGKKDMVVLPYKDRLALFSKYLQQLIMESIGKEFDLQGNAVLQGLSVFGNKGSTDQHAYVQQLRDGLSNFFVTFIEVLADDAGSDPSGALEVEPGVTTGDYLAGFLLGTREALWEKDRESITITIGELNANTLGALIALYERAVGFYASLVNINAYHQPGVEAGKKAAASVLEVQRKLLAKMAENPGEASPAQVWAEMIGMPDKAEWIFKLLERLAANPERGIERNAGMTPAETLFAAR